MKTLPRILALPFALTLVTAVLAGEWVVDTQQAALKETKLIAEQGSAVAHLGESVSLSGNTALAGAPDDDNENGILAGAAHVFVRSGGGWIEEAKLLPSDGEAFHTFGLSVALSGDIAVVGVPEDNTNGVSAGAAYVFERVDGLWIERAKLLASDGEVIDNFGWAVSVSGDTALVGAYGDDNENGTDAGAAYVFVRSGSLWTEQAKLLASDGEEGDEFGDAVSVSGKVALIGAPLDDDSGVSSGAAYVYVRDGATWIEHSKLTASDGGPVDVFGRAVSMSLEARTALVGAEGDDDNGNGSGSAYAFTYTEGNWIEAKLLPSDGEAGDSFGHSVSVFGNLAVISAPDDFHNGVDSGSAYIFRRIGQSWSEGPKLVPSDGQSRDRFGDSVSVFPGAALVGARLEDNENGSSAGSVYIYEPSHSISVAGACPGEVTIGIAGAEPGGRVALLASDRLGSDALPSGACASTSVGLDSPRMLATIAADPEGAFSTSIEVTGEVATIPPIPPGRT